MSPEEIMDEIARILAHSDAQLQAIRSVRMCDPLGQAALGMMEQAVMSTGFEEIVTIVRPTEAYQRALTQANASTRQPVEVTLPAESPEGSLNDKIMRRFKEPGVVAAISHHLVNAATCLKMVHDGNVEDIEQIKAELGNSVMDTVGLASF